MTTTEIKYAGSNNEHLLFPNGESIRRDCIIAVRKGDLLPSDQWRTEAIQPRVIVDFGDSLPSVRERRINAIILECETDDERDELASNIQRML